MIVSRKAVFLDIDGTLLDRGRGPFREDLDEIEAAVALGHRFFINTGRSLANIPRNVLDVLLFSGFCAGGGSHVSLRDPGERLRTVYHKTVPESHLAAVCRWYLERGRFCFFEGEEALFVVNPPAEIERMRPDARRIREMGDLLRLPAPAITKLTMSKSIPPEEREFLGRFFQVFVYENYSEAFIRGENKAKGMEIMLDAVGVRREDSVAIGDSANDLDMIRYAGLGVAMGNGSEEIKAAAGAVTGNCGAGGVGQAVRRHVLG